MLGLQGQIPLKGDLGKLIGAGSCIIGFALFKNNLVLDAQFIFEDASF